MLKARQALEKILALAKPASQYDNLFDCINSLYGIASSYEMKSMHTLRRLCNISVHGKTLSEHNVDNVLIALLVSCCWLFFKNDKKICPLSMFLQENIELAVQYVNVACDENVGSNKNSINPLSFDNTFRENTMLEQDILDKDVFETEEEYKNRISQLPPVHLGFGILDLKQTDPYSGFAFPRFSLSQKDKIISADIKAFISEPEK